RAEPPAVVGAFHALDAARLGGEAAGGGGRFAGGADVLEREDLAAGRATEHHRLAEDLVAGQLARLQLAGEGGEIPDVGQEALAEPGVAAAGLGVAFGHSLPRSS